MNWFVNLRIAHKLALGFGLCLSLAVLVGVVAITRMAQMNKASGNIVSGSLAGVEALAGFQARRPPVSHRRIPARPELHTNGDGPGRNGPHEKPGGGGQSAKRLSSSGLLTRPPKRICANCARSGRSTPP